VPYFRYTKTTLLQVEILEGQESFRIKSFVKSNVWGVFKAGQSIFKKSQLIECYFPIVSNKNIFY
jgi:molybdopterin molybdotransferase